MLLCVYLPPIPGLQQIITALWILALILVGLGALIRLFSGGDTDDVNPNLGDVQTNDDPNGGLGAGADIVYGMGTWVFDPWHEGWNEIHPVKVCTRIGKWDGDWDGLPPDIILRVRNQLDIAGNPATQAAQQRPEYGWSVHPSLDACAGDHYVGGASHAGATMPSNMSSTILHPALPQLGRPMTFEEWAAMDEDEPGELVDGRLEEEEVPDLIHELVVSWLIHVFRSWLGQKGFVFSSDGKYKVRSDRGRKPDVTVYLHPETKRPPARGIVRVPPDIVVEVVSPSPRDERRDRIEKMDEYAAFGVSWYWIIDPSLQSLEIFELIDGRYARAARATEGRLEVVPGCSALQLDLDEIWSEISRLDAPQDR